MPPEYLLRTAPVGDNLLLSACAAALPLIVLLALLAFARMRAHLAALLALGAAIAVAVLLFAMPVPLAVASALFGAGYGLFPIGWIVIGAIFIYDIAVATGTFERVKETIAHLTGDRRIQALFIAFCFGAFLEGASGFGTPVAIAAAMLVGFGFEPVQAAILALMGNTAPVAFAALGTPLIALAGVTGLPLDALSLMVGRQLAPFALVIPFMLVATVAGWRSVREVWPACLVVGVTYAGVQVALSAYHGPWLVGIAGGAASMIALALFLRVWKPGPRPSSEHASSPDGALTLRDRAVAWIPWIALSLFAFVWGLPPVKELLNRLWSLSIPIPLLDGAVHRALPGATEIRAERALFEFNFLSATGTCLLLAGLVSGLLLGMRSGEIVRLFGRTMVRMRLPLATIATMLALGYTMRYAGMDATLGMFMAQGGWVFPFLSPMVGWLGVAITGSDTSSNVLFGNLQSVTARTLHISPLLAAASNSAGGVMGKMINPQSIVVAGTVAGTSGQEGVILRKVFVSSLILVVAVGVLTMLLAYVWPSLVP